MRVFIVIEQPYHEGGTIVGVFDDEDQAMKFLLDRPNHPLANRHAGVEVWELEEWDIVVGESVRTSYLVRAPHEDPSGRLHPPYNQVPWELEHWKLEHGRLHRGSKRGAGK